DSRSLDRDRRRPRSVRALGCVPRGPLPGGAPARRGPARGGGGDVVVPAPAAARGRPVVAARGGRSRAVRSGRQPTAPRPGRRASERGGRRAGAGLDGRAVLRTARDHRASSPRTGRLAHRATLCAVTDEPIRVLRLIARLNVGGPSLHVCYLSSELEERGY